MSTIFDDSSSVSEKQLLNLTNQTHESNRAVFCGQGGRLARGSVGVMTFAPTLAFVGKIFGALPALSLGVLAASTILADESEAVCRGSNASGWTCTGTDTFQRSFFPFRHTANVVTVTLASNWTMNRPTNGSAAAHGLRLGSNGGLGMQVTQQGTASDTISISAQGHAVDVQAAASATSTSSVNVTLIRGIQSRANIGMNVDVSRGHANISVRNVVGKTGGIKAVSRTASTNNRNLTVTASRLVSTESNFGVYAKKDTSGTLTLSLAAVTGGSATTATSSIGVHVNRTGGAGRAVVTTTGLVKGGKYGIKANLTSLGNHDIKTAAITSSGHGVHITGSRQITFSSSGTIVASDGHGVYINRAGQTSTGNLNINTSSIGATKDQIHLKDNTASTTTITIDGDFNVPNLGFNGIYVNNRGSGNININISGNIRGGGKRNASPGPPSVSEKFGYALNLNSVTTGSAESGTGTITVTITSGAIAGRTSTGGAILNGDGNSSITFSSAYTSLRGNVKLGKGADTLVFDEAALGVSVELDGGQEAANSTVVDTLTFKNQANTGSQWLSLDPAKIKNWERINLEAWWLILGTKTLTTKTFNLVGTLDLSERSANDRRPDDTLTISGSLIGGGTIYLDVNLAAGTSDSITVTGNVTGSATAIVARNVTPSGQEPVLNQDINLVTVQGTTASNAFTLSSSSNLPSDITFAFRSTSKSFVVIKIRDPLCVESDGTAGQFTCSGTIDYPETMTVSGNTNINATLNSASTTVANARTGYIFTLRGANGITFTQSTGGGTLAATGSSTGIIDASTTGGGNIRLTLTGSASLAGSGTAIKAVGTGNGNVTIDTQSVTANHSQAMAVKMSASGSLTQLITNGAVSGGIEAKNTNTTGQVRFDGKAAISKNSGTAIYAYGKGTVVEVKTSSTVTGSASRTTNGSVGGIKVVNKNSANGYISIRAAGKVTSSGGIGIHAEGEGRGALNVTAGEIQAHGTALNVVSRNSGSVTINISGAITRGGVFSNAGDGILVVDSGSGNVEINTVAVEGSDDGIAVDKKNSGSVEITISGTVQGRGTTNRDYGIGVITTASYSGNVSLYLSNHTVIGGYAVSIFHEASGTIVISSSGNLNGRFGGVYVYNKGSVVGIDVHTVTASANHGIAFSNYGGSSTITVVSGGKIEAQQYGVNITDNGDGKLLLKSSGTITGSTGFGISITQSNNADAELTLTSVSGGWEGLKFEKTGTGTVTISSTGTIQSKAGSGRDGLSTIVTGDANVSITVSAVRGAKNAIISKNNGGGTISIVGNGVILASGSGAKDAGIYAYANASGGNISITINSAASVSGRTGIYTESKSTGNITITANGTVSGSTADGISAKLTSGTLTINVSANITAFSNAIEAQTGATGNSLITINSGTINATNSTGKAISNNDGSSTVIIHSAASVTADIALGGGADVLTFSGGSTFNRTITIDGGEDSPTDSSTDELKINSISALLDASKLTNWEVISFGTGTTGRFDGNATLATGELKVPTGAVLSLKDEAPGDTLTIGGKLSGGGTIQIDVNLSTGAKDSFVVQGDVTGVTKIVLNDKTPANASGRQGTIQLISYTGTSTAGAITLEGNLISQGYSYSIELDTTNKRFNLVGSRTNLLCVEDTNTAGSFACAGTINTTESLVKSSTTNIVATLANNATVSVSAFYAFYMLGENAITFTQAANGGTINATNNATGVLKAKTTGNGNVQVTLTGTATLAGSGFAVYAVSSGTGNITVTTQKVTASHASGRAILADGKGSITINANDEISGGIEVCVRGLGGIVTVNASSTVSSNKNDGIYVLRHLGNNGTSASITVNASGAVTGSRHGIYVKDSNGGNSSNSGVITVSASGTVTGTNNDGISVLKYKYGSWSANVGAEITTSGAVSGKRNGVFVKMYSVGDVDITINDTVTATDKDALYAFTFGENLTINISDALSGGKHGVVVHHSSTLGGSISFTATGAITGTDGYGVTVKSAGQGARATVTAAFAAVTGKDDGISIKQAGAVTVTANGAITSNEEDGIVVEAEGSTITMTSSSTVSGAKSGIVLKNKGAGAGTILLNASGTVKGTNNDGINVLNNRVGATTVTAAVNVTGSTSGITAKGTGSGASPVSVSAVGTVSATAGTGIYAYGKGASVSVTTSTTVSGSGSGVGGIKAVNKSSGAGTVSISAGGKITTTGGSGIHAENEGTGGITISAGEIEAHGTGVHANNSNSGAVTLNLSGAITSSASDGVNASSHGEDDLEVNTVAVTGEEDGIDLYKTGGGSITLTISGNIVANGEDNDQAGIAVINDSDGEDITLTLSNHSVTGAYHGMYVYNEGEGNIEITSTGTIIGNGKHGIYVNQEGGAVELSLHTVSGGEYGLLFKHYGSDTATITVASGGRADGGETGIYIYGKGEGDISLTVSGSIRGRNDDGLFVYHSGDANVTVSVASVSGKSDGIDLRKYGSGNLSLTATGEVESATGSEQDGLEALSSGAGNISIAVGAVTGRADGIDVRNYVGGTIGLTVTGAVVAAGVDSDDAGIYAYADEDAGNITITIGSSGSVSGQNGITAESHSSGNVTINNSGAVTGTTESGIVGEVNEGTLSITVSGNVTGASSKVAIDTKSEASGTTTIVINSGIITASGGTSIQNNGGASDVTIHSGATINEKISLGGGVDKLTVIGKALTSTLELDGGSDTGSDTSVDVLTFSGFSASLSASRFVNWETIAVAAGTTINFSGNQTLETDTLSLSGGVVSLSNDSTGDTLAIRGSIINSGSLGIDVNLSSGAKDTITVTGDLTGTHRLIVKDITRANETNRVTSVKVIDVGGTSSSPSLRLQNRFKSGGFAYSLEYNATQKAFFLIGVRTTINCVESTATLGNYTCRGNFSLTENILGEGSGNLVVVLDASAVVNVGASVAMNMEGAGSITFTQAAGGGSINATGSAIGVVHAKTSGDGNINISLTGTANLISSGTAILVDSTGTGTISVSTTNVTANNNSATAINLMGSGASISLHTQSAISGGKAAIIVKNVSSTGTVLVSAAADISSASGTAIYAYGKGASVTVSTGGQTSGNAMGIKAVNKSTGTGTLTVSASNTVTGSSDTGIYASNSGEGGLAITAGVVRGGKTGIDARNYTSGNLTINVTGTVTVPNTAEGDGINAYNKGVGDVTVSTVGVTGDASGVDIRNYGGGDITASFNGAILATGTGTGDAGIVLINDAQGGDVSATVTAGSSVAGHHGIRGEHKGSGAFLLNVSGAITGNAEDGISFTGGSSGSITFNVSEVSAAKRAIHLTNTGAGSVAITATGTVKTNATVTAITAISIVNSGTTTLTLSSVQATSTGVYLNSNGNGSSTITLNGAVAATGDSAVHGVYAKAGTRAGDITINVPSGGGVTGKTTAIKAVSAGSGSVAIGTSANLAATHIGIHASVAERGNISLTLANDLTVSDTDAVGIDTNTRSGSTTIVISGGTIGGKTSIKNNDGDSTVTVNKGAELDGNIELGGGVDKLTFIDSFDTAITKDGGKDTGIDRSKDVLAIESGSANIDITKLKNWEILQVGSGGKVTITGTTTLPVEQLMLAGTLSLKNGVATDKFTLSGDLAPHGTNNVGVLEVDVDFSTGESDTISISGDISGNHNLTLVDVSPSDVTTRFLNRISVVTVDGTSTASNLSLTGTRFASGGFLYKINFDDQTRTYYLTGERGTLKCGSSSEGLYACSGTIVFPENMRTIGNTAIVATLATGATVNVTAGVAIQMTSENSISFTQAAGGQPINASGAANGVVLASNTGRGNIAVTLTGTANLEGTGTGVTARSTGTGDVSVTTARVVANHVSATAIRASGRGKQVSVNATVVSAGRNGIIATNRSNGGTTSVVTTGVVTSSGTGIYAFSLSGNVNVNTTTVSGGVSAIVAKNDGGTGNVSVTTGGVVTGSGGAIQVYNYGTGTINVRATSGVTGQGSDGISVVAGADTTSITVSAANTTGRRNAIRVENQGTGTATINVSGSTIGNRGSAIHVENESSGAINIIASSQITGGNQGTGIDTRTNGGATRITLNAGASVSGASGFAIRNDEGHSEITVSAGASISGTVLLGGGVDRLTFSDATFGNSILNGGSDTGADVSIDVLTINGGTFELSEDSFVNWESIVFGPQTNISVNGVSAISSDNLTVQGTLSMQDDVTNDTLTIDGNLVGGGTIKLDSDFFTNTSDTLTVNGNVTGRTTIDIRDISASAGGRDQETINIISVTGSSTTVSFSLVNGGFTSGAYQYELDFLPSTKTYALSKKQSVGSVMLVAAPITLLDGFAKLPSLHERRSIDSTQSNWSRVIGNTNSYGKAGIGQAEYESQTTGLQAGFDFAKQTISTGTWVYGITAQFNSLNTDIKVATTEGELMAEGYGIGATATWVGLNGGYLDIQAQYNQITIDFKVAGSGTSFIDGQDSTAMAISMELGKRHSIGENLTFLTNGQISWGLADIGDVKSSSGQPIVFGDDANITARFGMRLEYNEEPYKLHLLANLYYDTLESWEATFANATYIDSKDPVSLELGLGGSMKLSPNSNLFMQGGFRKTTDDEFEQRDSAHFTTGVRWSW